MPYDQTSGSQTGADRRTPKGRLRLEGSAYLQMAKTFVAMIGRMHGRSRNPHYT